MEDAGIISELEWYLKELRLNYEDDIHQADIVRDLLESLQRIPSDGGLESDHQRHL